MKDWFPILRNRLPKAEPEFLEGPLTQRHVTSEIVGLVDHVWIRAEPDNPDADAIVEDVILRLIPMRETNPKGYAWARAALFGKFR
jgi:hypothetical protein